MKFDPNAKANTVSAALNALRWGVWCVAGLIVLILAVSYPAEDPNGYYSAFIFGVGIVGYYIGHFIQKYHDSILKKNITHEPIQVAEERFSLQEVDNFLAGATPEEKKQIDEAWEAPRLGVDVNGIQLSDGGINFMNEAYKRRLSLYDKRRIFLSLYRGAPLSILYDMLPDETRARRKKVQ